MTTKKPRFSYLNRSSETLRSLFEFLERKKQLQNRSKEEI
jgi:hypothetical protein